MFLLGIKRLARLSLLSRLPTSRMCQIVPKNVPVTDVQALLVSGAASPAPSDGDNASRSRSIGENMRRALGRRDGGSQQRCLFQSVDGQLLPAARNGHAEYPSRKNPGGSPGVVIVSWQLRRAQARIVRQKRSPKVADAFKSLVTFGTLGPTDPCIYMAYSWFRLARSAGLRFGFRFWSSRRNGTKTRRLFTFGVHSDKANYAFPCVDLRWDGHSWTGKATGHFWLGEGAGVMGAFWVHIEQRLSAKLSQNASVLCVLTVDDNEKPREVVWQIVHRGEAFVSVRLKPDVEELGDPKMCPGSSGARFENLVSSGYWKPSARAAHDCPRWINSANMGRRYISFQQRQFKENGHKSPRRYTFGVQSNQRNFAVPCADLRWNGHAWISNVTWGAWRGDGAAVMAALREDIEQRLDNGRLEDESLHCVLTADDAEDPQEIVWQIVRTGGTAVVIIPLERTSENRRLSGRRSTSFIRFEHLAKCGPWTPSDAAMHGAFSWPRLARASCFVLRFKRRQFCKIGQRSAQRYTFGMQSDRLNYAIPCADLRWDGHAWIGNVTWDAWRGDGCAVMAAFREEIEQVLVADGADDVSWQCALTVDDVEDTHELVWQIVRTGRKAVIAIKLHREGEEASRPGTGANVLAYFAHLVEAGSWSLSDSTDCGTDGWAHLARAGPLFLSFQQRQFIRNGTVSPRRYTFGVQSTQRNFALPCADLRWDGHAWIGNVTLGAWRGAGGAVTAALREELEQRLGAQNSENASLQCVITVDDHNDPQEIVWHIVRPGGSERAACH